jgi:hypothetical protein
MGFVDGIDYSNEIENNSALELSDQETLDELALKEKHGNDEDEEDENEDLQLCS